MLDGRHPIQLLPQSKLQEVGSGIFINYCKIPQAVPAYLRPRWVRANFPRILGQTPVGKGCRLSIPPGVLWRQPIAYKETWANFTAVKEALNGTLHLRNYRLMRAPQYGHSKAKRRSSNAALPAVVSHNPKRDQPKSRNDTRAYQWSINSHGFNASVTRPKARRIGHGLTGKPLVSPH